MLQCLGDKTDEEADTQNAQEAEKFDGYYFVNNLGRLSAAPQVRYIDNLVIDGITLNGYYYFDENGRLVTEPGIHSLEMDCYEMILTEAIILAVQMAPCFRKAQ